MRKTQLLDALRNIRKQMVSFLSIVVIAALGVTMFLGIDFSASAIQKNATAFYNEKNYRDIELVSTLLLSRDDLNAIRSTEGVKDVEGICFTSAKLLADDTRTNVEVLSLTERINLPILCEGRLPAATTECAIEQSLADTLELHTGDTVAITNAKGETAQYLTERTFVVCGIVVHPDHVCSNVPFTPYIMVTPETFDAEKLNGCCMKAEIVTERAADAARFESAYTKSVGATADRFKDLGALRAPIREAEVHTQAEDTIADYREQLKSAEQELSDARAQLDQGYEDYRDGEQQYAEGEQKLIDARAELDDAKQQLVDGEQELKDARAKLDDAKAELEAGEEELAEAKKQLDSAYWQLVSGWDQLEDAKAEVRSKLKDALDDLLGEDSSQWIAWASPREAKPDSSSATAEEFWITETFHVTIGASLADRIETILETADLSDDVLRKVFEQLGGEGEYDRDAALDLLADRLASIAGKYQEDYDALADGCSKWDQGHNQYLKGKAQYAEGLAKYEDGLKAYNDGEAQYAEALQKYEDGLKAYNDGEADYEQGVKDLEAAREYYELGRTVGGPVSKALETRLKGIGK